MKNKRISKIMYLIAIIMLIAVLFTCSSCEKENGLSAYEIAVENGFQGTEAEWLESLVGEDGTAVEKGYSAYEIAVQNGFEGTELEWLDSLVGDTGEKGETYITNAVNEAILSVVSVTSGFNKTVYNYWGNSQEQEYASAGSGIIFQADKENGNAYIVTNYHVVYDVEANSQISDNIKVYLYGMELEKYGIEVSYVGGSMTYDIAVLKIENSDIFASSSAMECSLGTSGRMSVGDNVIAIGNPEASGIAVTSGILSKESEYIDMTAADNTTNLSFRVMRIDAAVNGGNSGGGLFNDSGELIGIVNAKIVSNGIEGIAYAIPIDLAYSAIDNIIKNCDGLENKKIQRCLIGVSLQVTDSEAIISSENDKVEIKQTISIESVEAGSIADVQGLQEGDVISSMEYKSKLIEVKRIYSITDYSLHFFEGDKVKFNILRNNEEMMIEITLGQPVTVE